MGSFSEMVTRAKDTGQLASKIIVQEAMTWDAFRWVVVVLLVLNLFLMLLLFGGSGSDSELSAMKEDQEAYEAQMTNLKAEVDQKIEKAKTELHGDIAAVQSGLMKELRKSPPTSAAPQASTSNVPLPTRSPARR